MAHRKQKSGRKRKYYVYARKKGRRQRPRRGLLSDPGRGVAMKGSFRTMGGGALGGIIAKLAHKVTDGKNKPIIFLLSGAAASFISSTMLKAPLLSAGIAGGTVALWGQSIPMLNDNGLLPHQYVDGNMLSELPMYLDDAGRPVYQLPDGTFAYMSDIPYELSQGQGSFNSVYPGYINPGFYDQQ